MNYTPFIERERKKERGQSKAESREKNWGREGGREGLVDVVGNWKLDPASVCQNRVHTLQLARTSESAREVRGEGKLTHLNLENGPCECLGKCRGRREGESRGSRAELTGVGDGTNDTVRFDRSR